MKLLLLHLLICIYSFLYGQWTDWQEAGMTACGPVLVKFEVTPDNKIGEAYELKIKGTPDPACIVVLRSYFKTASGTEISDEVALDGFSQWQHKQQSPADSIESFVRTEVVSATGCSCNDVTGSSDEAPVSEAPASLALTPDSSAVNKLAETPALPENLIPDSTASVVAGSAKVLEPAVLPQPSDSSVFGAQKEKTLVFTNQEHNTIDSIGAVLPDTALTNSWSMASSNEGLVSDSAAVHTEAAAKEELKKPELTAEQLDSIRIFNDPFILEGLHTIADAHVRMEQHKLSRGSVADVAREQLELLEEKQALFIEKYTKLVRTGFYGLTPCYVCGGNPIIYKNEGYPSYEPCAECKGGGYRLTYQGGAKPKTIEHLYFAELLPTPDYRKPTMKRIAENPADFEYENGVFETEVKGLAGIGKPYFFVCLYYKGNDSISNRMVITEIISKEIHEGFQNAGKEDVLRLLEPHLSSYGKQPDDVCIWEFETFEDAYNRSIMPLHKAGVVGFDVEVVKLE